MSHGMLDSPKLSFCIATRNRAELIRETLTNILSQATPECEIVVVDGASTDDTEDVVKGFVESHENVRYFKQEKNGGVDQDFDRAVEFARGEYCWLMPDDDLLKPDAVRLVLDALMRDYSLIVMDTDHFDAKNLNIINSTMLKTKDNHIFKPYQLDDLFKECWGLMTYIGSFVMCRKLWIERERRRYYGTDFIHIGVIFQKPMPGDVFVIATPLVSIRTGNQSWTKRWFVVWAINWPSLVESLPLGDSAKLVATQGSRKYFRSFHRLLFLRAMSAYSMEIYCRYARQGLNRRLERLWPMLAALVPGGVANTYLILGALFRGRKAREGSLMWLRRSEKCVRWWRLG